MTVNGQDVTKNLSVTIYQITLKLTGMDFKNTDWLWINLLKHTDTSYTYAYYCEDKSSKTTGQFIFIACEPGEYQASLSYRYENDNGDSENKELKLGTCDIQEGNYDQTFSFDVSQ
jgi:hypothetical protein